MLLDSRTRRARRAALALLATVALAAGCGGDDAASDDTTTTEAESTTTTGSEDTTTTEGDDPEEGDAGDAFGGDLCSAFSPAELEEVTGIEFADGVETGNQCTYAGSAGEAFVTTVQDVSGSPAGAVLAGAKSQCDEGTANDEEFEGSEGGVSCLSQGIAMVATVGSSGDDAYLVVLTAADPDESVDPDDIRVALIQILRNATGG